MEGLEIERKGKERERGSGQEVGKCGEENWREKRERGRRERGREEKRIRRSLNVSIIHLFILVTR